MTCDQKYFVTYKNIPKPKDWEMVHFATHDLLVQYCKQKKLRGAIRWSEHDQKFLTVWWDRESAA